MRLGIGQSGEGEPPGELVDPRADRDGGRVLRFVVFTSLVGGTVQTLPPEQIYAGGVNRPLVLVELKLPDIGLADREARAASIAAATAIVRATARPGHRDEDTWINILNARDGYWGAGGRMLANEDLVAGIMAAAGAPA